MPSYEKPIILPSKGLLYGDALPGGEVTVRSMTTQEEKLLASGSGTTMINNLFKRCTNLPKEFPPSKLLVMDRFSLLLHIRVASYGPAYQISYNCGSCGALNYEDIDIEAEVLSEEEPLEIAEETFDVELPNCGKTVTIGHTTGADEAATEKHMAKGKARRGGPSDLHEYRTARQIHAIDGATPDNFMDVMNFVRSLATRDNVAIRDAIKANSFGVSEVYFNYTCKQCGSEQQPMSLPVSEDFFRVVSPGA